MKSSVQNTVSRSWLGLALIAAVAASLFALVVRSRSSVNQLQLTDESSGEYFVSTWRILGPFKADQKSDATEQAESTNNYLLPLGGSETTLRETDIAKICRIHRALCRTYGASGGVVPLHLVYPGVRDSFVYATAVLMSQRDVDAVLDINVNPGAAWINGHQIALFSAGERGGTGPQTHRMLPVHFAKGNNVLTVKTIGDPDEKEWVLALGLIPLERAASVWTERSTGHLLETHLFKSEQEIRLHKPSFAWHQRVELSLADSTGTMVFDREFESFPDNLGVENLKNGYYHLTLRTGSGSATDGLYIGDYSQVIHDLLAAEQHEDPSSETALQRDPIIRRYQILVSAQYAKPDDQNWQRKLLLAIYEGQQSRSFSHDAAWTQVDGMHFREYVSAVDGTRQPYLLYLPKGHPKRLRLVFEMPYATKRQLPFLESGLAIGYPDALDDLERAADRTGLAVAVIHGRGSVGDSPIGEDDVVEVLNDIEKHYAVDARSVYLFGTCEGGARAIMLAEHYPGVFAAVGAYGPTISAGETIAWWRFDSSLRKGVFAGIQNLAGTPIRIDQGQFDNLSPRDVSERLVSRLKRTSPHSEMHIIPDGLHGTNAAEERLFPWLAQFTNGSAPPSIDQLVQRAAARAEVDSMTGNDQTIMK